MLLEIDHVQITIPKDAEETARQFYCRFLGLRDRVCSEMPENEEVATALYAKNSEFGKHGSP